MSNRTHPAPGPAAASPVVAEHVPVLLLALLGVLGQLPHALAADLLVAGPPEEPHLLLVLTRLQGALSRGDALELKSRQDQPGTHGEGRRVESQAPRSSDVWQPRGDTEGRAVSTSSTATKGPNVAVFVHLGPAVPNRASLRHVQTFRLPQPRRRGDAGVWWVSGRPRSQLPPAQDRPHDKDLFGLKCQHAKAEKPCMSPSRAFRHARGTEKCR